MMRCVIMGLHCITIGSKTMENSFDSDQLASEEAS